jgi:thiamine biosynthesis lipoprotein
LDRAGRLLVDRWGVSDALLHGGHSSVLALGCAPDRRPWRVGIPDPLKRGRRLGVVQLSEAALGTAGSTERYFKRAGRRYSHVLDPRSGRPVQWRMCVSVIAATCAEADALATAALVMGPDQARRFFQQHEELGAVLVCWDAAEAELEVETLGTAEELFERTEH